jgi:uncharacterized protein
MITAMRRNAVSRPLEQIPSDGSLHLQCCRDCATVQYPPREVCRHCLGDQLRWQRVDGSATVLASTVLQHSLEEEFLARLPWCVVSLKLAAGPVVFAHVEPANAVTGKRLRVAHALMPAGSWCLFAFDADDDSLAQALEQCLHRLGLHA